MRIEDQLKDKKILIWGYGREGKSTEQFIKTHCICRSVEIFEGKREEIDENRYDLIIKSPGIKADHLSDRYTSQTELFLEAFADRTIGITGTKGKSTTSSLLYHVLDACYGGKTFLVGNIGYPCLEIYDAIEEDSIIVFEMSCHQLAGTGVSPHIAVFLNLFEDHLDYYGTRENYFKAKQHIALYQKPEDWLIIGDQVPYFESQAQRITVSYSELGSYDLLLKGSHNQYNADVVYRIATQLFGCSDVKVRSAMKSFHGLPHRMEFVGNVGGVDYYNDSISTIPEATIRALTSIDHAKTVLVGGMDRQIHYEPLIDFIRAHGEYNYILAYESGARILKEVEGCTGVYYRKDLAESLTLAREITPAGSACILSPAAASYGYFKNFEDRGNVFREMVLAWENR